MRSSLSLTFVPAMVALLIRGKVAEKEVKADCVDQGALRAGAQARGRAALAVDRRGRVALSAAAVLVFTDARQRVHSACSAKATSPCRRCASRRHRSTNRRRCSARSRRAVAKLPEVAFVFSKTGTAEVASDPMPPNASDTFIILKPKDEWPAGVETKDEVIERIENALKPLVGNAFEISQPIQLRFNELIAGVRGDIAIKIYGDDLDAMGEAGAADCRGAEHGPGCRRRQGRTDSGLPDARCRSSTVMPSRATD